MAVYGKGIRIKLNDINSCRICKPKSINSILRLKDDYQYSSMEFFLSDGSRMLFSWDISNILTCPERVADIIKGKAGSKARTNEEVTLLKSIDEAKNFTLEVAKLNGVPNATVALLKKVKTESGFSYDIDIYEAVKKA